MPGRGKIPIRRIEKRSSRQATFMKRRAGLRKKAEELAILCDVEVGLIAFSCTGKLFQFASSSMPQILERYKNYMEKNKPNQTKEDEESITVQNACFLQRLHENATQKLLPETQKLLPEKDDGVCNSTTKRLEREDVLGLNLKDLSTMEDCFEHQLRNIKAQKELLILEYFQDFLNEESKLHRDNKSLKEKISNTFKLADSIFSSQREDMLSLLERTSKMYLTLEPSTTIHKVFDYATGRRCVFQDLNVP